ncbi:MAG TPA: ribonuclease P protein component [Alphaproteobacteria bacterium]|nr:ribonuclease P protein component [Alphaproteobacteria bacterium]
MAQSLGRLTRRPEFLRVAASRQRWVAPGLILQAYKRRPADPAKGPADAVRLGLTASRKVGGAVERNRARRRLREAARLLLPAGAEPGYDLVLVARAATLRRPFAALVEDLRTALERLRVARGPGGDAKA